MRIMQHPCRIILGLTLCCLATFVQGCQKDAPPAPAAAANALDASVKGQAISETTPAAELPDWGRPIDPDQDCKFTLGPRSLTVELPASWHDLAGPPLLKFNAPRVLREVDGDFVLTVKVSGDFKPRPPTTSLLSVPYLGGGILLWSDSDNFIRLERATLVRDGQVVPHIAFLKQEGGEGKPVDYVMPFEENDCYLRLERKEGQILGAVSGDGADWKQLNPTGTLGKPEASAIMPDYMRTDTVWSSKLKVGLLAISTSSDPFSVKFEQIELKTMGAQSEQALPEKAGPRP